MTTVDLFTMPAMAYKPTFTGTLEPRKWRIGNVHRHGESTSILVMHASVASMCLMTSFPSPSSPPRVATARCGNI